MSTELVDVETKTKPQPTSNVGKDLTKLPVIGPKFADCSRCELQDQCDKGAWAPAYRPKKFNGLMFIGEGAGYQEVAQKEPFVGRAGQLLRALCEESSVGLNRDECYITNATLCLPQQKVKSLNQDFPNAIYSCLPRLEKEISLVRPRVIVTLGAAALISVTGYEEIKKKRVPLECTCNSARRIYAVQCTSKDKVTGVKCTWFLRGRGTDMTNADERGLLEARPANCPGCGASLANQKPKFIKCPVCKGLKTSEEETRSFEYDFNISDIAGGVLHAEKLASRFDEFGVAYIIPTFHPAFLLRPPPEGVHAMAGQFAVEPVLKHFAKARRLLTSKPKWDVRHVVTTDPAAIDEYTKHDLNYAVDVETEAFGFAVDDKTGERKEVQLDATNAWAVSKIKCIGVGSIAKGHMLVVDTREAGPDLIAGLRRFLANPKRRKTMMNGIYDYTTMRRLWGIATEGYVDDVQTAHHALYPDEDKGLAHQAFSYTDSEAWKPPRRVKGTEVHESFEELALYNARDVYNTDAVREAMGADNGRARPGSLLVQEGCDLAYEIDMVMQRIAVRASWVGMPIDMDALNAIGVESRHKANEALYHMQRIINDPAFNPDSYPQLVYTLFDPNGPLRLIPPGKTDKGQPSTSKDDLAKLAEQPFVQHLLKYRESDKVLGTFVLGEDLKPASDGRIHPNWKVHGTVTGRWSSSPNFQNWPKWIRACVVAPKGRKIVGADYAQLELRILAALCNDPKLIKLCIEADESRKLEADYDPHAYVASRVFGDAFIKLSLNSQAHLQDKKIKCKCETCTRKALRDIAKRVIYGLNYGAGAATVLASIYAGGYEGPPVTLQLIERTKNIIFAEFKGIPVWRDNAYKTACKEREIRSPIIGRRRVFPLGDVAQSVVYNYPIQSGGADIINSRLEILDEKIRQVDPTAELIAQVHDAVYFECAEHLAKQVSDLVEKTLSCEFALVRGGTEMPFPAAAAVAQTWKDAA